MKNTDWTRIKNDYITGTLSCRSLAHKYNCSPSTVLTRCKADDWVKQRNQFRIKAVSKTEDVCSDTIAAESEKLYKCTGILLDKVISIVQDDNVLTVNELFTCARILKEIKLLYDFKSELDTEEQKAKIRLLKKQSEAGVEDNHITVVIDEKLKEYSI